MTCVGRPQSSKPWILIATLATCFVARPQPASAQDDWVQVLSDGHGTPARTEVHAMIGYRGYIYVACQDPVGAMGRGRILRASLRDDTVWVDSTPPWGVVGSVTDMVLFQNQLFVSNEAGEIWRLGLDEVWHPLTPGWPGSSKVFTLSVVRPAAGGYQLCAARGHFEIWCGFSDTGWRPLPVPAELADDATIGSAKLQAFSHDLYLGVGAAAAVGRICEAWKLTSVRLDPVTEALTGDWLRITADCLGTDLQWLDAMAVFTDFSRPWLFMGTGGHGNPGVIFKTDGRVLLDASPRDVYDYGGGSLARYPVHIEAMDVVGDRLYVGIRSSASTGPAEAIFTDDGESWRLSDAGFDNLSNDAVSALAHGDAYLYAGISNHLLGFQVWRRTPGLPETLPFLFEHLDEMAAFAAGLQKCVFPFDPSCVFSLAPLRAGLDSIALGFERSQGDPQILQEALGMLNQASVELNTAQGLVNLANKESARGKAQQLRSEAMAHVNDAIDIVRATLNRAVPKQ